MIEKIKFVQDLLYKYQYIQIEIEQVNDDIINLAEIIENQRGIKIPTLSDMPRGSGISDSVLASVEKIIDIYYKETAILETKLEKLFEKKHLVEDLLKLLNNKQLKIIELRYFKKYKWWMIANTVNYSEKQCRRIERKALEILVGVINNEKNI